MKKKPEVVKHQNIQLKVETKKQLESFGRKGESYDALIRRLLHDVENVNFEILDVDGGSPAEHSVTYIIGQVRYRYADGKYTLVAIP